MLSRASTGTPGCAALLAALALAGCGDAGPPSASPAAAGCDPGDAGLRLPPGFCAMVVADHLSGLRHLVVAPGGDLYVTLRNQQLDAGGVAALRDADGDGRAEHIEYFGDEGGVGIALRDGWLYFGADSRIVRWRLAPGILAPAGAPEVIVEGFSGTGYHAARAFVLDDAGGLLLAVGAPSNACQEADRVPGSPGRDPCPELATAGGIWRYEAGVAGQRHGRDGRRHASGIRHSLALDREPATGELYLVQHGRDDLHEGWPALYAPAAGERLPAEELLAVRDGSVHGWPYCYFDPARGRHVLAPEYGGDGDTAGRCARLAPPALAFPAHASPNDMLFYRGEQFPLPWRSGAFVALHGAYTRDDGSRSGYQIAFVPFRDGVPAGGWEVFADGFAGTGTEPEHRPTGLAVGPDGSLYVADSQAGRIWRISHTGRAR